MKTAVLDTSVIIKWYHFENEDDVDAALVLRNAYLDGSLSVTVPDLLIYEFTNTLRFKNNLSPDEALASLRSLWSAGLNIRPVDENLSSAMFRLSCDFEITVYDAAYLALAEQLRASLVTADKSFYQKTSGHHAVIMLAEFGKSS